MANLELGDNMNGNSDHVAITASALSIYENGALTPIAISELCDNEIAIRQLINEHNLLKIEAKVIQDEKDMLIVKNQHLSTIPFISIMTNVLNVILTIVISILVNILTNIEDKRIYVFLIALAGLCMIIISLANILYPFSKDWFKSLRRK